MAMQIPAERAAEASRLTARQTTRPRLWSVTGLPNRLRTMLTIRVLKP